jgi:hypothetical protein
VSFIVTMIWPGAYLVVASTGDVVGVFGSVQEVDEACEQYALDKLTEIAPSKLLH